MAEAYLYTNDKNPLGDPNGIYGGGFLVELASFTHGSSYKSLGLDEVIPQALLRAGMDQGEFEDLRLGLREPQSVVASIPLPIEEGKLPKHYGIGTATISTEQMGTFLKRQKIAVLVAAAVKPVANDIDIKQVQRHGVMTAMFHRLLDTVDPDMLTAIMSRPQMRESGNVKTSETLDGYGFEGMPKSMDGWLSRIAHKGSVRPIMIGPKASILQKRFEEQANGMWLPSREVFEYAPVAMAA